MSATLRNLRSVLSSLMRTETLETMALALPCTRESAHFGKRDFRVGKRIFMTLPEAGRAVFKLTPDQQQMLLETEPGICAAVPGSWGEKGWTSVYFTQADLDLLRHIMQTAWQNVAPKKLALDMPPTSTAQTPSLPA